LAGAHVAEAATGDKSPMRLGAAKVAKQPKKGKSNSDQELLAKFRGVHVDQLSYTGSTAMKKPSQKLEARDPLAHFARKTLLGIAVLMFTVAGLAVAQTKTATSYDLQVSTPERGLLVLRLTNNQGTMVVCLPDGVREGEPFSGTFNSIGTALSSATLDYSLELGEQRAKLRDGAFHWRMPEKTGGHVRLRFTGYGEELAVTELAVVQASDPIEVPLPGGDKLHLPTMIQSGLTLPIFGPLDGDSSTTSVEVAGQKLQVLAEVPGKAIVSGPNNLAGMAPYEIRKGAMEGKGETRVVNIEQKFPSPPQRNGKTGRIKVRVSGIAGVTDDVPIKFEIVPRQDALFQPTMRSEYSVSPEQLRFIEPREVKKDGSYSTQRTITRILPGPMSVSVQLVIPQTLRNLVEIVLRTPQRYSSRLEETEHAEDLKPYGDAVLPVLADFMVTGDGWQRYAAYATLFALGVKAAPWVIARIPQMYGQPLSMALDAYTRMALTDPLFPYRKELRAAALDLIKHGDSWATAAAVESLGKIGTEDDIPLLEEVYQRALRSNPQIEVVRDSSNAALARLGVKENIDKIAKQLETPVKVPADATSFQFLVEHAVYANRKELVPYLCLHIHDPSWSFGDVGVAPASEAITAIAEIEKPMRPEQIGTICKTSAIDSPAPN
jgi:hypothetical protein